MPAITPDDMRARFRELKPKADPVRAKLAQLRAKRDKIEQDAMAALKTQLDPIDAEIKKVEAELAPVRDEMVLLSRALGGKT